MKRFQLTLTLIATGLLLDGSQLNFNPSRLHASPLQINSPKFPKQTPTIHRGPIPQQPGGGGVTHGLVPSGGNHGAGNYGGNRNHQPGGVGGSGFNGGRNHGNFGNPRGFGNQFGGFNQFSTFPLGVGYSYFGHGVGVSGARFFQPSYGMYGLGYGYQLAPDVGFAPGGHFVPGYNYGNQPYNYQTPYSPYSNFDQRYRSGYAPYNNPELDSNVNPDFNSQLNPSLGGFDDGLPPDLGAAPKLSFPIILTSAKAISSQQRAEAAFREGDYRMAARLARQTVRLDSENGLAQLFLSQTEFAVGDYKSSAQALLAATKLLPSDKWNYVVTNFRAFYGKNDYVTQTDDLSLRIAKQPNDVAARVVRGFHYGALGYPDSASEDFRLALAAKPDDELANRLLPVLGNGVAPVQPLEKLQEPIPSGTPPRLNPVTLPTGSEFNQTSNVIDGQQRIYLVPQATWNPWYSPAQNPTETAPSLQPAPTSVPGFSSELQLEPPLGSTPAAQLIPESGLPQPEVLPAPEELPPALPSAPQSVLEIGDEQPN